MTTFEIVRDLVLLVLGLIGTGLSLYNLWAAAKRDRRELKLTLESAIPVYFDGSSGDPYIRVIATNTGHRDVSVASLGVRLASGAALANFGADPFPGEPDTPLPTTLADGHRAVCHYPYADVGNAIAEHSGDVEVHIIPYAVDTTGTTFTGEGWPFKPSDATALKPH